MLTTTRQAGNTDRRSCPPRTVPVILLLVGACAVALAGCRPVSGGAEPRAGEAAGLLAQLVIAGGEGSDHDDNRAEWGDGWAMHGDGCDTRELVLIDQGDGERRGRGCKPVCPAEADPCWISPYDGRPTHDLRDLQIDHRVSIGEAARSLVVGTGPAGEPAVSAALAWTPDRKHAFFEDRGNLVAVTGRVNQAKADLDAGDWQPPLESAWCDYATRYATTKVTWGLSVDQAEYDALARMLATCPTHRG